MSQTTRPLAYVHSRTAVLANENIDTDRIIPARFLTTTERTGLGKHCFEDWRYNADGTDNPSFVLNQPASRGCSIIVAGHNFGCGSSREHAPWALLDFGIQAVISSEIADIFRGNALKNGLLAIVVSAPEHRWLIENPGVELRIDVASGTIRLPDGGTIAFDLDAFARHCLLNGVDQLGFLTQQDAAITAFEARMEEAA
ncbi:3-isopropylmalate/(R)-2-methylmalate dehydratase small subunit [Luteibacter sp. Sphag1AF]|uniref:3-isopropylmalate dehydratase small subunit n=1 Tax=Luteibacter sp. Sphag1AF TaxID=2587031 RepID=UPI00161D191E|nr:3-isopropylmalate dehydratase small subunit [Luteibacter sp. Sphag1AF]MBB3227993.1 3-isopropylmalate/(R)-2-methylmalate dehydratase small subunit [Luteibacter sp. Sphag1AF]